MEVWVLVVSPHHLWAWTRPCRPRTSWMSWLPSLSLECPSLPLPSNTRDISGLVQLERKEKKCEGEEGDTLFTSWQDYLRAPPSHTHMEGVITAHLGVCPPSPTIVHLEEGLVLWSQNKVHCIMHSCYMLYTNWLLRTDHSGASSESSSCSSVEIVNGNSTHERQLHVSVSVNATCAWCGEKLITGVHGVERN